jgi:hypothetical protein
MRKMEASIRAELEILNNKIDSLADKLTIRLTKNMVILAGVIVAAQKLL